MPSLPKFIRRNSSQRTVVGDVHGHGLSDKVRAPVDQGEHEFRPPTKDDIRSVCPALNTLANHGYIPRDGKNISFRVLSHGLQAGYGVSPLFADFLVVGGYILLRQSVLTSLNLQDIGRHNGIEHNASIVHDDDDDGEKNAPTQVNPKLLHKFLTKAYTPESLINSENKDMITIEDIARTRVSREEASSPVDPLHAEIARGEFAMVLNIFGKGQMKKLNAHDLQVWLDENKFPPGWSPSHTEHLFETVQESKKMRELMMQYRGEHPKNLFMQLEKLVTTQGHGVLAALWRVIETMIIKIDSKTLRRRSTLNNNTPSSMTEKAKEAQPVVEQVKTVAV